MTKQNMKREPVVAEVPTEWRRIVLEEDADGKVRAVGVEPVHVVPDETKVGISQADPLETGGQHSPQKVGLSTPPMADVPSEWQDVFLEQAKTPQSLAAKKSSLSREQAIFLQQEEPDFSERTIPGISFPELYQGKTGSQDPYHVDSVEQHKEQPTHGTNKAIPLTPSAEETAQHRNRWAHGEKSQSADAFPFSAPPVEEQTAPRSSLVVPEPNPQDEWHAPPFEVSRRRESSSSEGPTVVLSAQVVADAHAAIRQQLINQVNRDATTHTTTDHPPTSSQVAPSRSEDGQAIELSRTHDLQEDHLDLTHNIQAFDSSSEGFHDLSDSDIIELSEETDNSSSLPVHDLDTASHPSAGSRSKQNGNQQTATVTEIPTVPPKKLSPPGSIHGEKTDTMAVSSVASFGQSETALTQIMVFQQQLVQQVAWISRAMEQSLWRSSAHALLVDLLLLYDFIDVRMQTLRAEGPTAEGRWQELSSVQTRLITLFAQHGVSPLPSSELEKSENYYRVIQEVITTFPEEDGKIARIVRQGFCMGNHVFRPAEVEIKRFPTRG